MIGDYVRGISSYLEAISFIRNHELSRYYWYSGIIGVILLIVLGGLSLIFASDLADLLLSLVNVDWGWLVALSTIIVKAGLVAIFFIVFKYLMLIFTAPMMSMLSEDVESTLDGDYISIPFSTKKALSDLGRALKLSSRNILREVFYTLGLLLLGLFPLFAIASAPLIFLVQAYFAGFGNMDFYLERHYNSKNTIRFVALNKGLAMGNGTCYVLLLAIPILGAFFAPVLGATAAALEVHKKIGQEYA